MFGAGKPEKRRLLYQVLSFFIIAALLFGPGGQGAAQTDTESDTSPDSTYYGARGGGSLRQGLLFSDVGTNFWARDSIIRMAAQGLLQGEGDGRFQPGKPLSRQEAVAGLVKALGMEKEALEAAWGGGIQADTWAQGFIAMASQEQILDPAQMATLNWMEPAARQEMAVWLAKALKLTPAYGGERRSLNQFLDAGEVDPQAAPWIDPVLEEKLMSGMSNGRFDPQGRLTRAQLAVILDQADSRLRSGRGITEHRGVIKGIEQADSFDREYPVKQTQVRVDNPGGVDFLVFQSPQKLSDGGQAPLERSAAVYSTVSKRVGGTELLKAEQEVRFLTDSQNEVFYIEIMSSVSQSISGFVQEVDPAAGRLVLVDQQGGTTIIPLGETVEVEVNSQPAALGDLLYGQQVEVLMTDGKAISVKASLSEPNPGYLPPERQVHYGRIIEVGDDTLRLLENGREVEYSITPYTSFARGSQSIMLEQVRPGDMANVYLEYGLTPSVLRPGQVSADPLQAARVVLEGTEALVVNVYRGLLQEYLPVSGELVLRDAGQYHQASGQYQQANWVNQQAMKRLEIGNDTKLFLGGRQVSLKELKRQEYRGRRVYAAARDSYGGEQVVHLSVEPASTYAFYDQIYDINYGESWFSLADVNLNDQRIAWDDGTLVLHEGRLVGPSYLQEDQDTMVLASALGDDYRAAVVIVEQPYYPTTRGDEKYLRFVCGTVEDMSLNQIELDDAYEWTKQKRRSLGDERFYLSQETQVIDSTDPSEPAHIIDLNDLYAEWGAEGADEQYVYMIAYGDQILAINLRSGKSLPPTAIRFRAGKIVSIKPNSSPPPQVSIVLDQVKDWVGISKYWELDSSTSVTIDLDRAQVVRQGKADQPTLLQFENASDRLSVLRRGDQLYWLEVPSGDEPPGNVPTPVLVMAE